MFASITHIPSLHKILSNMPEHKLSALLCDGVSVSLHGWQWLSSTAANAA
jgi:hypothetical protein